MTLRLFIGGLLLLGFLAATSGGREVVSSVRGAWREGLVIGTINGAVPFTLIAWGETHIDSGVAGVANSSVPIFVALLALRFAPSERSSGLRVAGLMIGLAGVAVVVGLHPGGGWWGVVGTLAVVLASLCYAVSSLYIQRRLGVGGPELAAASVLWGAVVMLPFALADLPDDVGWKSLGAIVALGVVATGIATLIVNSLIAAHGPARTMLVNYLLPGFALVYGVTLLGEPLTAAEVSGLALILVGVTLAAGLVTFGRRVAPLPEP
jgi:drug/metabolite transporter (DMT)-like permease